MAIPKKHKCNPFECSPSGDLFYADKRNLDHLDKALKQARDGQTKTLSKKEQEDLFGL